MAKQQFQNVRGMPDILPEDQPAQGYLRDTFQSLAEAAGYTRIDTPILEDSKLWERGVGSTTDIVEKEMFTFEDRGGNQLAMRPEPTAAVVRAYIQHGMSSRPQPVRLWIEGLMFRYDRPQAGRQRQFSQLGVEVFGEAAASIDAQIIVLALRFYTQIGLKNVSLQINSIGDKTCRPKYRKALLEYLEEHKKELCEDCQQRLKKNPMRILDCKESSCRKVVAGAPQTLNYLCDACHKHFAEVLEYLDAQGVAYELNPGLVRGLDYYTRTVFEFYGEREGAQSSLGGGGRYDDLVEELGGQSIPATGFGIGIERVLLELKAAGVELPSKQALKVFVASLGDPARLEAFGLIEKLLDGGVGAVGAVDKDGIGGQLERANKLGVPYAVIIGQKEVKEGTVIVRDMKSGAQEMIPLKSIVKDLQHRFS